MALERTAGMLAQQPGQILQAKMAALQAGNVARNQKLGFASQGIEGLLNAYLHRQQRNREDARWEEGRAGREAQVEATKAGTAATKQKTAQSSALFDSQKAIAEAEAIVAGVKAGNAPDMARLEKWLAELKGESIQTQDELGERNTEVRERESDRAWQNQEWSQGQRAKEFDLDLQKFRAAQAAGGVEAENNLSQLRAKYGTEAWDMAKEYRMAADGKPTDKFKAILGGVELAPELQDQLRAQAEILEKFARELPSMADPVSAWSKMLSMMPQYGAPPGSGPVVPPSGSGLPRVDEGADMGDLPAEAQSGLADTSRGLLQEVTSGG